MITLATLAKAKYYPEVIPGTARLNLPGPTDAGLPLDLRRFSPLDVRLKFLSIIHEAGPVLTDIRRDDEVAVDGGRFSTPSNAKQGYPMSIPAKDYLAIVCQADPEVTAPGNVATAYSVYVSQRSVADKLKLQIPLTPDESQLDQELHIANTVEKGLLPLGWDYVKLREFDEIEDVPVPRRVPVGMGLEASFTITTKPGEFLVLYNVYVGEADMTKYSTLRISRDEDYGYAEIDCFAIPTGGLPCWIPALSEFRVTLSNLDMTGVTFYTLIFNYKRFRLTNLVKAKWGLSPKSMLPGDVWEKVKGGIL